MRNKEFDKICKEIDAVQVETWLKRYYNITDYDKLRAAVRRDILNKTIVTFIRRYDLTPMEFIEILDHIFDHIYTPKVVKTLTELFKVKKK